MISNLLSNALKYTEEGGWIRFLVKIQNNETQITISDSGIGIAPEHLPKIFDRFYRVDSARCNQSGGIGLGLSIVKTIVELHHGCISIVSELNKGTTVFLTFNHAIPLSH
jgi:signal transduction histidine kinase